MQFVYLMYNSLHDFFCIHISSQQCHSLCILYAGKFHVISSGLVSNVPNTMLNSNACVVPKSCVSSCHSNCLHVFLVEKYFVSGCAKCFSNYNFYDGVCDAFWLKYTIFNITIFIINCIVCLFLIFIELFTCIFSWKVFCIGVCKMLSK